MEGAREKIYVGSFEVSVPPFQASQREAWEFLEGNYRERLGRRSLRLMKKIFEHPSVARRHFALEDPASLMDDDPDARMARFTREAAGLAAEALHGALARAGIPASRLTHLVVNTCTGYICPGISTYLIEKMGLSRRIRAFDLVGSGCGGAIPNLEVARGLLSRRNGVVASVSVEICSCTFQMGEDLSLMLSNALFADGAAAAILWDRPQGFELGAGAAFYAPEHRESIRYVHKGGQLHNQLSPDLPELVKEAAREAVGEALRLAGLEKGDVRHWALHTGGEKIINAVRDALGLSEGQVLAARRVLADFGNMSSPTVWFVLKRITESEAVESGDWCMMVAFGAGLSAHALLLRKT
ncbi:MAG: hypothetical protein M0Z58_04475 [Nitrospiraceae bacterium]|nr:hypothetical protein [Nitrospiraceae bacterium]